MKKIMTLVLVVALMMVGAPMTFAADEGAGAGSNTTTDTETMGTGGSTTAVGTGILLTTAAGLALIIATAASNDDTVTPAVDHQR